MAAIDQKRVVNWYYTRFLCGFPRTKLRHFCLFIAQCARRTISLVILLGFMVYWPANVLYTSVPACFCTRIYDLISGNHVPANMGTVLLACFVMFRVFTHITKIIT